MIRKCLTTGLLVTALAAPAAAVEVEPCTPVHWQPNRVYTLKAGLHKATHIILPQPILGAPIVGNRDLWVVEGQGSHIFIKPTTLGAEGKETTVTAIGIDNTSYNFNVQRATNNPDICVEIRGNGNLIEGSALGQYRSPQQQLNSLYQQQIEMLRQELDQTRAGVQETAEETLQKYRTHIYTRYTWTQGSGFMGQDLISDVWDDGRFTYIRLNFDNKGVLTVAAEIDGKKEFIEYQYDSDNRIYRIVGIYPEFNLKYGDSKVRVNREDNRTAGAY
jgi:type IV secretory pathway VirB9-like protein